jgi:hypothetical protein
MLSVQATIAAACYAILMLATQATARRPVGEALKALGACVVSALVGVCVLNCYVTGGCHALAWALSAILAVTAAGAVAMATAHKETLIVRDQGRPKASAESLAFAAVTHAT